MNGPAFLTKPTAARTDEDRQDPRRPGGILAIDTATTSGWAYLYPGNMPVWGHERFGPVHAKSGEVMHRAMMWIDSKLIELRPAHVVRESVYFPVGRGKGPPIDKAVLERLCGLGQVIDMVCYERSVDCKEIDTSTWCKFFTGTARHGGRKQKKAATVAACTRYGWIGVTEDEADALGIAAYAESVFAARQAQQRQVMLGTELPLV